MQDIQPVIGWALNYVAALDRHHAGACGAFMRASPERRQVISALLATRRLPADPKAAAELAQIIGEADHRSILSMAFNDVPVGLRGALRRSGSQPHNRVFYPMLCRMLTEDQRTTMVIGQMPKLDLPRLNILRVLPVEVRSASLIAVIGNAGAAADVCALLQLLRDQGLNYDALVQSLRQVSSPEQLSEFAKRWATKCKLPEPPLEASDEYSPVETARDLRRLSVRFRNCSWDRYLVDALEGRSAFAEFTEEGESAVIHLRKYASEWVSEGIYGKDNKPVSPGLYLSASMFLSERNIGDSPSRSRSGPWKALRRLSRSAVLDFEEPFR